MHCQWILLPAEPQGKPKYWSGQPIPSPVDLPNPGIELGSSALQADSLPTELSGKPLTTIRGWERHDAEFFLTALRRNQPCPHFYSRLLNLALRTIKPYTSVVKSPSLYYSYANLFLYCSWGSQGKNTEVVYHFLLQWTAFCQNSSP